jgi:progressive ankylosis protein
MFMSELMMISHVVINAFLARMDHPEPVLAAYGVSFGVQVVLSAPVWACSIVFLSFIKDRASMHRLTVFGFQVWALSAWLWLFIALAPVGNQFFRSAFGVSSTVADAAQYCLLVSAVIAPITIFRSLAYGLLMVQRKTLWVTIGTLVRLVALAGVLSVLTLWFEGAVIGAYALLACIAVETVFAVAVAVPFYLRSAHSTGPLPTYRELWRFSWPVMVMQVAESGVALAVHFFLGRLPNPVTALAGFTVLDSIMRLILSPLRNLIYATQTLVRVRADARVMVVFALHMAILFGAISLLFNSSVFRDLALQRIMGLTPSMAQYITPALQVGLMLALCMAVAAITRGLLIASKNTGAIAVSSAARVGAVIVTGAAALVLGAENGAMVGLVATTIAFAAESLVLGIRLWQLDRRTPKLFAARDQLATP